MSILTKLIGYGGSMVLIICTKNESNLTNRYWDMVPDRQKVQTDGMDGRTQPNLYPSDFVGGIIIERIFLKNQQASKSKQNYPAGKELILPPLSNYPHLLQLSVTCIILETYQNFQFRKHNDTSCHNLLKKLGLTLFRLFSTTVVCSLFCLCIVW